MYINYRVSKEKKDRSGRKESRELYHVLNTYAISALAGVERIVRKKSGKGMMTSAARVNDDDDDGDDGDHDDDDDDDDVVVNLV